MCTLHWVCKLALCAEYNRQQSHAHIHAVLGLTEVRCSLVGVKVRAATHNIS